MTYETKELLALDKRLGRTITLDDWRALSQKSAADLTDDDLVIIGYFGGAKRAAERRAQRTLALNPPAAQPTTATNSFEPVTRALQVNDEPQTLEEFRQRYGKKAATVEMVMDTDAVFVEVLKEHKATIAALRGRIEKLESRPLQKWAGIHVEGAQYAEASLVTRQGSLWAATCTTTTTPGDAGSDWRLIVKRGSAV